MIRDTGDDNRLRSDVVSTVHDEVEPGDNRNVQAVPRRRSRALPHGALRAARSPPARVDAQDTRLPRATLERVRPTPRGVYQQTRWCTPQQVRTPFFFFQLA